MAVASPWHMKCNVPSICECRTPVHSMLTSQCRVHVINYSCGTRIVVTLTRYGTRICNILTEVPLDRLDPHHFSWNDHLFSVNLFTTVGVINKFPLIYLLISCAIWQWCVYGKLNVKGLTLHNIINLNLTSINFLYWLFFFCLPVVLYPLTQHTL